MTWQRRERTAARALGTTRTVRRIGESAPDVEPVRLASGVVLSVEVKSRRRLPRLLALALAQAARYAPGAVPVAVVSERGGPQLACIALRDFARLLGFDPPALPERPPRPRRRDPRQTGWAW